VATNRAYRQVFTSGEIRGKHHGGVKLVLKTQFGPWPYVLSMEFEGGRSAELGFLASRLYRLSRKALNRRDLKDQSYSFIALNLGFTSV